MYIDHVGINTNDMEATLQRDSFSLTRAHAREGRNENPPRLAVCRRGVRNGIP